MQVDTAVQPNQVVTTNRQNEFVISVRDVTKSFGKNDPTVRDLNFQVKRGEIFCLLGPSGSGKSTTMRMLTGVYKPTSGQLTVLGMEPSHFTKRTRTRIGYMPQQFVLFPELSTTENMNFMASVYGMSWFKRRGKVRQALEFVDLWEARNRLASQLSGGMQRRLELATTLIHQPDLIFVDEPTAGIDPILRAKFWEHFKSLRDSGRTLFVTTQYVTEADYCDTVAILSNGRLLALGTPEEIRHTAMNGEIIDLTLPEITTQAMRLLRGLPDTRRIRILSSEDLRLTVGNATETLKEIVRLFEENNINIQSIQPYRPDFEEVFVQLMEQDNRQSEQPTVNNSNKMQKSTPMSEQPTVISTSPVLPPMQNQKVEALTEPELRAEANQYQSPDNYTTSPSVAADTEATQSFATMPPPPPQAVYEDELPPADDGEVAQPAETRPEDIKTQVTQPLPVITDHNQDQPHV